MHACMYCIPLEIINRKYEPQFLPPNTHPPQMIQHNTTPKPMNQMRICIPTLSSLINHPMLDVCMYMLYAVCMYIFLVCTYAAPSCPLPIPVPCPCLKRQHDVVRSCKCHVVMNNIERKKETQTNNAPTHDVCNKGKKS